MIPVAVAWFSSNDIAIRYVLPVLWMTSCFRIIRHVYCMARLTVEGCQSAGGNAERTELQHFSSAAVCVACR